MSLPTFFFFKTVLAIQGPLHFHMNFRISLSISVKKVSWDFDRCLIEYEYQFVEYYHLNNIKLFSMKLGWYSISLDL